MEAPGTVESSTALRKAGIVKGPSIGITYIDDAVDYYLMPNITDPWPPPANEEDEDLIETLRTDLRVAITEVLANRRVRVVDP